MTTTNKILGGIVVLIMTAALLIASSCDSPPEATAQTEQLIQAAYAKALKQEADTAVIYNNMSDAERMRGVVLDPVEK